MRQGYKEKNKKRRVVLEFSFFQFLLVCLLLSVSYLWIFGLGITIGRSVFHENEENSFFKEIALMLGYHPPPKDRIWQEHASSTWTSPEKMERALGYYEDLTKPVEKSSTAELQPMPKKKIEKEEQEPPESEPPPEAEQPIEKGYTILAASFQNPENAKKFEADLKAKGYPVAISQITVRDVIWHRVTVGTFQSRDDALKFVSMFNAKEHLEAIVIQK